MERFRGKITFEYNGQVSKPGEEEAKLPRSAPRELILDPIEKGKWTMGEDGKLIPYVEKPKPVAPQIIFDYCEPFVSHHDGRVYTSKKAYRAALKRDGFTEVGDQTEAVEKLAQRVDPEKDEAYQRQLQEDIEKAMNDVKYNEAPLSDLDKEICKRRNEARAKEL